jgi:hypothetical protein
MILTLPFRVEPSPSLLPEAIEVAFLAMVNAASPER